MAPNWLTALAWVYLGIGFVCAGVIVYDIFVNHRRQPMGVMDAVFPITALYLGPFALGLYLRWGRAGVRPRSAPSTSERPWWATMAIEVSHCGAGCTLGDLIAEWVIFALALTIAGYTLFAEYVGDYLLALAFGIVFQYFAIAPMRGLGLREGLKAAARADFLSLTCFEIGLFGWMALMAFVFFPAPHHLTPTSAAFWFLMQIGMIIGYFTSWPANVWLVRRGIKVPM
ncbi:MAG TPA: DUF4396 domain-containing protein [Solirubrobacterales bacterium]|jgi:hypothetical protein|nr:DUF4396 domain-containing protein [Solirubrobacterales bacterium]